MRGIVFPDKKESRIDFDRVTRHIVEGDSIRKDLDVSQDTAEWIVPLSNKRRPAAALWMTDIHYGAAGTDYKLLQRHLDLVENTPNMFAIIGGDTIDNFSAAKHPVAATGDVIPPQLQAQAFMEKMLDLDKKKKIGAFVFGNHEAFTSMVGLDYWTTFMRTVQAPVFSRGGILLTKVGDFIYKLGLGHKHWGVSKINPENAARRGMEFTWPNTDAVLIGDDHMAAGSVFDRGGERKIVADGGTYKLNDSTGLRWGLGHAGKPGYTLLMWPDKKHMELASDPENALPHLSG